MIDQTDQSLKDWVTGVIAGVAVSFGVPAPAESGSLVNLYLLEVIPTPLARTATRAPLQVMLRYVVTAWADSPEEAHHLLGQLVFAALENPDFEVDPDPLPAATWAGLGTAPRPAFVIRVPLRLARPEPEVKYVRSLPSVQATTVTDLVGLVLGPNDIPLTDARVELVGLGRSVRTDRQGRFRFALVPDEPQKLHLLVTAKGRELSVQPTAIPSGGEPLVIHFNLFD
jgi:hypothetical protein